jgi:hypothetical protein
MFLSISIEYAEQKKIPVELKRLVLFMYNTEPVHYNYT